LEVNHLKMMMLMLTLIQFLLKNMPSVDGSNGMPLPINKPGILPSDSL
jgi:hypothetical protein